MTRVLVTGATGFVGTHLVQELRSVAYDVDAVGSRSGDVALASTWIKFAPADVVIHLAGKSFVPDSWTSPVTFVRCNSMGTVHALEYCRSHGAALVFLSSYLYGNPATLPIVESAPIAAANPYALSKRLAEEACRFYADHFGVNVTVLRPFNVYGPGQLEHFLLPSIIRQVIAGGVVRVKDLEPRRDFVYVRDLVHAIVSAVAHPRHFSVCNIGSGVSYSVEEVIRIVQDIQRTDLPVESSQERRKEEVMDTVADIHEAKRQLGWTPRWTISEGVRETIASVLND